MFALVNNEQVFVTETWYSMKYSRRKEFLHHKVYRNIDTSGITHVYHDALRTYFSLSKGKVYEYVYVKYSSQEWFDSLPIIEKMRCVKRHVLCTPLEKKITAYIPNI